MKMNQDIKARWVAALRSGEYAQTQMALKDSAGHCCLGVLCDLFAKEAGIKRWSADTLSDRVEGACLHHTGDGELPGARVVIWSGLDPDIKVTINGDCRPLFGHNDDGRTFAEIADAIEAQL